MNASGTDIVNTSIGDGVGLMMTSRFMAEDGFEFPDDFATDGFVFTVLVDDAVTEPPERHNNVGKSDGTVTLKATADLTNGTTANPFDAVHFYVAVGDINTGDATTRVMARTELRLIAIGEWCQRYS